MQLRRWRNAFDIVSTLLVTAAGIMVLWNQWPLLFQSQTQGESGPGPQSVTGLSIDAAKLANIRGTGPVVLVEFTDYECPFCGHFHREALPAITRDLVGQGLMRHAVLNLPLEAIHPNARLASQAVACAGAQGKFWEMQARVFQDQKALTADVLTRTAATLPVDLKVFARCLETPNPRIAADIAEAKRLKATGTPTFFLGTLQPDGTIQFVWRFNGAIEPEALAKEVRALTPTRARETS